MEGDGGRGPLPPSSTSPSRSLSSRSDVRPSRSVLRTSANYRKESGDGVLAAATDGGVSAAFVESHFSTREGGRMRHLAPSFFSNQSRLGTGWAQHTREKRDNKHHTHDMHDARPASKHCGVRVDSACHTTIACWLDTLRWYICHHRLLAPHKPAAQAPGSHVAKRTRR